MTLFDYLHIVNKVSFLAYSQIGVSNFSNSLKNVKSLNFGLNVRPYKVRVE